jgi:hypothetical protein
MSELSERLFTEEDVKKCLAIEDILAKKFKTGLAKKFENIHAKIQKDPKPNYYYNKNKFDEIYVISDIHADYKTLLRHLVKFEFIKYDENSGLNFENIDTDKFDIYNPKLISDVKWTKSKTLLVICGDIVDGARLPDGDDIHVNDEKGTFEILLHMFLRNLKLQAQDNTSDVMLIAGNHDDVTADKSFWNNYVHPTAKTFFINMWDRQKILTPFYKNFSLFFGITNIDTEPNRISNFDILFMHGGIHHDGHNFFKETLSDQKDIDTDKSNIMKILHKYTNDPDNAWGASAHVTWARDDAEQITSTDDKRCNRYNNLPTIIVGHCTNLRQKYSQPFDENRKCSHYYKETPFCIYPKCFKDNIPKVINIDTTMSGAFFPENRKDLMEAFEMLKIYKGEQSDKFNKYTTVSINKGGIQEYDLKNVYETLRNKTFIEKGFNYLNRMKGKLPKLPTFKKNTISESSQESPKESQELSQESPKESQESPKESSGGKTRRRKRKTSNKSKRSKRIKKSKQTRKRGRKTRR